MCVCVVCQKCKIDLIEKMYFLYFIKYEIYTMSRNIILQWAQISQLNLSFMYISLILVQPLFKSIDKISKVVT